MIITQSKKRVNEGNQKKWQLNCGYSAQWAAEQLALTIRASQKAQIHRTCARLLLVEFQVGYREGACGSHHTACKRGKWERKGKE